MKADITMKAMCFCAVMELRKRPAPIKGDMSKSVGSVSLAMLRIENLLATAEGEDVRAALALALSSLQYVHGVQAVQVAERREGRALSPQERTDLLTAIEKGVVHERAA